MTALPLDGKEKVYGGISHCENISTLVTVRIIPHGL
jgi:hypothetical protein